MHLKNWLHKPYPFIERSKGKIILASSFGIFVYVFLSIFQPFGASEITHHKHLFLLGFGVCVFIGIFLNYMVLPNLFTKIFDADQWQIKKEMLFLGWNFLLIALFNYTYNTTVGSKITKYHSVLEFIGITISVGIFPVIILIFLTERNLNTKNSAAAKILMNATPSEKEKHPEDSQLSIVLENVKLTPFEIDLEYFIFATSANNYTTIFYVKQQKLHKKLFRLSIKNLEQQLTKFKSIVRCHRSYLVNKQHIKTIKGNARSLVLVLEYYEEPIPVSRSFPKENLV